MRSRFVATLVALSAVLGVGATAAVASAAPIKYVWKVNGATLTKGAEKKLTAKDVKAFVLKLEAGGSELKLEATGLRAESGARLIGQDTGKEAGTSEETLVFEDVTVVKPKNCGVIGHIITTVPLRGEIVESALSKVGTGKSDLLLKPKAGSALALIKLEGTGSACQFFGSGIEPTGSILAETLPQGKEEVTETLKFSEAAEYIKFGGTLETAGLKWAGNPAPFTGEAAQNVTTGEKFAAF